MSSAMATQQFAANVLRTGARKAGRSAPVRANRMTVRACYLLGEKYAADPTSAQTVKTVKNESFRFV